MTAPTLTKLEVALEVAHALGDQLYADKIAGKITEHNLRIEELSEYAAEVRDTYYHSDGDTVLEDWIAVVQKVQDDYEARRVESLSVGQYGEALRVCLDALNDPERFSYSDWLEIESSYRELRALVPGRLA